MVHLCCGFCFFQAARYLIMDHSYFMSFEWAWEKWLRGSTTEMEKREMEYWKGVVIRGRFSYGHYLLFLGWLVEPRCHERLKLLLTAT